MKKVLMMSLSLGLGIATLNGGTADAGNWSFLQPPGMWWYYGSVDGCASIGQVPNPDKHPALLSCDVNLTRIETLCTNPANHDVRPGEAATKVSVFETISPDNYTPLTKNRGKADVCVTVNEGHLGNLCVNPNWHLQEALVTEFLASCTTEQCTGDGDDPCTTTVPKDTQVCQCSLPDNFSVDNAPEPCADPLHPDESCTAYICKDVEWNGMDWEDTGRSCQLQE